jgi:hypothetical protein
MIEVEERQPILFGNQLYQVELNDGLSEFEIEEATSILRWIKGSGQFFGVAGVMLITGPPRSGKDTFANTFAYKVKRYYKGIKIIRDDHATPLFGKYTYWDERMLADDLDRMKEIAQDKEAAEKATAERWITEKGTVMMQKSVVLFTEAWQKMNNRNPMSVVNKTLGGLNKMWGHTETLYMYITQWTHDLDRFTCLPWVTMEVRCKPSDSAVGVIEAHLYHVKFNYGTGKLIMLDKYPVRINVDAGRERQELGVSSIDSGGNPHYYRYWDLFNSKSAPLLKFNRKKMEI